MLLLVVDLGGIQRHGRHGADRAAGAVVPGGEHGVVKLAAPAGQRLEGPPLQRHAAALGGVDGCDALGPFLADARQLAAGDHRALRVDDADGAVRRLLELQNYVLEDTS